MSRTERCPICEGNSVPGVRECGACDSRGVVETWEPASARMTSVRIWWQVSETTALRFLCKMASAKECD